MRCFLPLIVVLQFLPAQAAEESDGGQCSGVFKLVEQGKENLTLVDDYGNDCTIGETKRNRAVVLENCEEGHWCVVLGEVRPYKSADTKHLHVFVNDVFLATTIRNRLPESRRQAGTPTQPTEPAEQKAKETEQKNELELHSLGTRSVNEGVTRQRYVPHSFLQLTNVSNRPIKVEEWWINHRRGAPLCSKTSQMEDSFLDEAAKLKKETGRDISQFFGRQLRALQPGEFLTLDINNDYCGSVFRVDVRTDRQTEFWTVN